MINWAVYDEGMKVWKDGKLMAIIPCSQFKILSDLALWLRDNDTERKRMARFEMILSIAKRSSERELYTEETKYVCFCENLKDLSEITDTANEVIQDELEDSEEGEVLFGSADVIVNDLTILMLQYTNSELQRKK